MIKFLRYCFLLEKNYECEKRYKTNVMRMETCRIVKILKYIYTQKQNVLLYSLGSKVNLRFALHEL